MVFWWYLKVFLKGKNMFIIMKLGAWLKCFSCFWKITTCSSLAEFKLERLVASKKDVGNLCDINIAFID